MCSPQAIAGGVQATAAVGNYFGGRRLAALNTASLADANAEQMQGYAERGEQINRSATDQMSERAKAALIEQGRLRATGGGASGASWDRLFERSTGAAGRDIASIEANRVSQQRQNIQEARATRADFQSKINQIRRPNLLTLAGDLAGAASTATLRK